VNRTLRTRYNTMETENKPFEEERNFKLLGTVVTDQNGFTNNNKDKIQCMFATIHLRIFHHQILSKNAQNYNSC
jgi:hypothetical protein